MPEPRPAPAAMMRGRFVERSFSSDAGTRAYKLYIPEGHRSGSRPLMVMLHGCNQNPDDFAAGTRMNEFAQRFGFLALYPAQSADANGMNCWNWFSANDQVRDGEEPSLIAGMTREVASEFSVDHRRIGAAGLSAGGAMAVIMSVTYPDIFSVLGVHSGLPYGAANSPQDAFAAMSRKAPLSGTPSGTGRLPQIAHSMPTIVFHGDADTVVNIANGSDIVDQAALRAELDYGTLRKVIQPQAATHGRECTITGYQAAGRRVIIEYWMLHGAGHAWSGGSAEGSFTDPAGPDASAELVRFFLANRRNGSAPG